MLSEIQSLFPNRSRWQEISVDSAVHALKENANATKGRPLKVTLSSLVLLLIVGAIVTTLYAENVLPDVFEIHLITNGSALLVTGLGVALIKKYCFKNHFYRNQHMIELVALSLSLVKSIHFDQNYSERNVRDVNALRGYLHLFSSDYINQFKEIYKIIEENPDKFGQILSIDKRCFFKYLGLSSQ